MFNKEERTYWIENYKKFPTSNISDAMDNLGLRSGIVLGLRPLDVCQPRTAGFAKTLRQMRRKTAFDGKSLTKQASIIDSQTEYGDLLVIGGGLVLAAAGQGQRSGCKADGCQAGGEGAAGEGCVRHG